MNRRLYLTFAASFLLTACAAHRDDHRHATADKPMPQLAEFVGNCAYQVDDMLIPLHDGKFEAAAAPGSAERIEARISGNAISADLNADGTPEAVLILQHRSGGSGTFYYLAAARQQGAGCQGSNAVFLGDRIFPGEISVANGIITVNYLDRAPGTPMAAAPDIRKTMRAVYRAGRLEKITGERP